MNFGLFTEFCKPCFVFLMFTYLSSLKSIFVQEEQKSIRLLCIKLFFLRFFRKEKFAFVIVGQLVSVHAIVS